MMSSVFYLLCLFILIDNLTICNSNCDINNKLLQEGILNNVLLHTFPWLGILKVHLHEINREQIAVSGLVLIADKIAIVNANDIAKIPKKILLENTRAMFIPKDIPRFYRVKDFITHPEYRLLSYNTIALVELYEVEEDNGDGEVHIAPICLPAPNIKSTIDLYIMGYTDENEILEKSIHKLKFVDKLLCRVFYEKHNLTKTVKAPIKYQCASAINLQEYCVWSNGMVVASNSSGYWVLIGFTVQGPGCSAPARYIDITSYLPWIKDTTTWNSNDVFESGFRKTAFGTGFKLQSPEEKAAETKQVKTIPIHELFLENPAKQTLRTRSYFGSHEDQQSGFFEAWSDLYPHVDSVKTNKVNPVWRQISTYYDKRKKEIIFELFPGDCTNRSTDIAYQESTIIGENSGKLYNGIYWVTLNDDRFRTLACIIVKMEALTFGPGKVWIDFDVVISPEEEEDPMAKFLKDIHIPIPKYKLNNATKAQTDSTQTNNNTEGQESSTIKDGIIVGIAYLTERPGRILPFTMNLAIKFSLIGKAKLDIKVTGMSKITIQKFMKPVRQFPKLNKTTKKPFDYRRTMVRSHRPKNMSFIEKLFWSNEEDHLDEENAIKNNRKDFNAKPNKVDEDNKNFERRKIYENDTRSNTTQSETVKENSAQSLLFSSLNSQTLLSCNLVKLLSINVFIYSLK